MYLSKVSKLKKGCLDLFILKNTFKEALPIFLQFSDNNKKNFQYKIDFMVKTNKQQTCILKNLKETMKT